ncbi:MAG TPA: hypothetical protein VM123_02515 [archaeon]|nr:hypothetical protein [archaeon]
MAIYDDNGQEKKVTERFNGSGPLEKKLTKAESSVVKEVCAVTGVLEKAGTIRENGQFVKVNVKGYPVLEEGWRRVITFMEPIDSGAFEKEEYRGDIYSFLED